MAPKVRVLFETELERPSCPHGPSLLFERSVKGGDVKQYFACSAYRDRKQCSFYQPADVKVSHANIDNESKQKLEKHTGLPNIQDSERRLLSARNSTDLNRGYCHTCCKLYVKEEANEHKKHTTYSSITAEQLLFPSKILIPKSNSKEEAQYLFSSQTCHAITTIIETLNKTNVLCIGTPRIFEHLRKMEISCFLVDLDDRYHSFLLPDEFSCYNMFNHHFLRSSNEYHTFLQSSNGNIAIVMDPPFGGRVDVLSRTIEKVVNDWKVDSKKSDETALIFLMYPYFNESQVKAALPDFNMVDYKISYDNHRTFQPGNKGRKLGSPVRIFTNANLKDIVLPEEEGYHFCSVCDIWVGKENKHCFKCGSCTSKNGDTYRHCKKCNKCVKPTWMHCNKCKQCALPKHPCCSEGNVVTPVENTLVTTDCNVENTLVTTDSNVKNTTSIKVKSGKVESSKVEKNAKKRKSDAVHPEQMSKSKKRRIRRKKQIKVL